MNKRGLIGKIFAVIGIVILILIVILGITAYQAYILYEVVMEEGKNIEANLKEVHTNKDCSKLQAIQESANHIDTQTKSTCKNPIIKILSVRIQQLPVNCNNYQELEKSLLSNLDTLKQLCANQKANQTNQTLGI